MLIRIFIGMLAALVLGTATAAECPASRSVMIKEGHFGARNVRAYNAMISMQVRDHRQGLEKMLEDGTIIRLPTGKHACIARDVATASRTWVTVPGHEGAFWVHSRALKR